MKLHELLRRTFGYCMLSLFSYCLHISEDYIIVQRATKPNCNLHKNNMQTLKSKFTTQVLNILIPFS